MIEDDKHAPKSDDADAAASAEPTDEAGNADEMEAADENGADGDQADEYRDLSGEELIEMLISFRNRADEMKDGYIRAKADVENIQRRSQNEIVSARKYAIEGFARELFGVIDSLDQASKVDIEDSTGEAVSKMKEGLELTLKQFDKVLEKFGITAIEADKGVKFDPELHQAISMMPSDEVAPDHILSVMQKGFRLKDRLLRPAMVVIARSGG